MIESPQTIRVSRDGDVHDATVTWWTEDRLRVVAITSSEFEPVEARANDAFEALCLVREELEPLGWRIGVTGAQADVWPSGMARDQGGGLVAYRMTDEQVGGIVPTFEPVDPATVTTVTAQRAEVERRFEGYRRKT